MALRRRPSTRIDEDLLEKPDTKKGKHFAGSLFLRKAVLALRSHVQGRGDSKDEAGFFDILRFVFQCGPKTSMLFLAGCFSGALNGFVYPLFAHAFSTAISDLSSTTLEDLNSVAYRFLCVGMYAFIVSSIQISCLEVAASHATTNLRNQWFRALLRQDRAFFDVVEVTGTASSIGPTSQKYRRCVGRKFGEGIQFLATLVSGLAYAMWSSWRVTFIILATIPLISYFAFMAMKLNEMGTTRRAKKFEEADGVVYAAVSAIRTVFSLNAVPDMIKRYSEATSMTLHNVHRDTFMYGFHQGGLLGSFMFVYTVLCIYGSSLIYHDVQETGCDPSGSTPGNACKDSGVDAFAAMLSVLFAALSVSQVANFLSVLSTTIASISPAIVVINRKTGSPTKVMYFEDKKLPQDTPMPVKAILPKYDIDATSTEGLRPARVAGRVSFENVAFHYPLRPQKYAMTGFNLDVEAGKTIALVGASGSGKSTIVKLLERFYDPQSGSIKLDGIDIRQYNLRYLRSKMGYVGQEPSLFATSIAQNIRYGNPSASDDDVWRAASLAGAHEFIMSFPEGYNTHVGHNGTQLSGGQKQRIAIARTLIADPAILILDEATSALDTESELVVQRALDDVLASKSRTTFIIAHRLSTIRNADTIVVVDKGVVVETGTHDELFRKEGGYYHDLVVRTGKRSRPSLSRLSSVESSSVDEVKDMITDLSTHETGVCLEFKDVKFAYPTRPTKAILNRLCLQVRRNETIALVGPSGEGKSTIMALIERFYDPSAGSVSFHGHDLSMLNVSWYRSKVGYVGQEPTLFRGSIADNISLGTQCNRADIEDAARRANAYNFIVSLPRGFETVIGEGSSCALSGGQKQRVAIARALVRRPEILLLDEATSALDSTSETMVHEALDGLTKSRRQTIIMIAHRLATVRHADRIAFIAKGQVKEIGSHDELVQNPKSRYAKLLKSQSLEGEVLEASVPTTSPQATTENMNQVSISLEEDCEERSFAVRRLFNLVSPQAHYIFIGVAGIGFVGSCFPILGYLLAETVGLLFHRVEPCGSTEDAAQFGFETCEIFWIQTAGELRDRSHQVAIFWSILIVTSILGTIGASLGFGNANRRLEVTLRDTAFAAMLRQEVAFFDCQAVGELSSRIQEATAAVIAFTEEPVGALAMSLASVMIGIGIALYFMWPMGLLTVVCLPFMGFAMLAEAKKHLGSDIVDSEDDLGSPNAIIVETLSNMETISALVLEESRAREHMDALRHCELDVVRRAMAAGCFDGLAMLIQNLVYAVQLWFGGWLIFRGGESYVIGDLLASMFACLFGFFGLGVALRDVSDRESATKGVKSLLRLVDRQSAIDPLSMEGIKLD